MNPLSILICSCDKYSFTWNLHIDALEKNWEDRPYPVFLGSDSKKHLSYPTLFNTSNDRSWSSCLTSWLNQIDTEYVLLTLDDFILRHHVNTSEISTCLDFVIQEDLDCLRLIVRPKPFNVHPRNPMFGEFHESMHYLVAVQPSIWKKSTLLSLIRSGESIWEFEHYASVRARSRNDLKLYGTYKTVFDYGLHIIDGGKLLRSSIINIPYKNYNIVLPFVPLNEEALIIVKRLFYFLVNLCPTRCRIQILEFITSIKKENKTVINKTNSL